MHTFTSIPVFRQLSGIKVIYVIGQLDLDLATPVILPPVKSEKERSIIVFTLSMILGVNQFGNGQIFSNVRKHQFSP